MGLKGLKGLVGTSVHRATVQKPVCGWHLYLLLSSTVSYCSCNKNTKAAKLPVAMDNQVRSLKRLLGAFEWRMQVKRSFPVAVA